MATVFSLLMSTSLLARDIKIYVQVEGAKGESADDQHRDWIDAKACSESLFFPTSIGSTGGRQTGRVSFTDVKILKAIDLASPTLREMAAEATPVKRVTIEFWDVSAGRSPYKYMSIVLDVVFVSEVTMTTQTPDIVQEVVAFAFTKITWTYIQLKPNGQLAPPVITWFDVSKNTGS